MKKYIITLGALIPAILFGQLDRSKRPLAQSAPTINIKDSEVFKTANGITVVLSENHKIPAVSFELNMGSDPFFEGPKAGLSELTGSLITSGTTNRSKDQFDREVDYIGATIGATGTSLSLNCLTKHIDKGMTLFSDVLLHANFPESEFDRIKNQSESELMAVKSDPNAMAKNAMLAANFAGHPKANIMTEQTLAAITREDVLNYFKAIFTPKGSYLVVVGDITRAQLEKVIESYLLSWNGPEPIVNPLNTLKPNSGNRVIFVKKPGAVQSVISVSFPIEMKLGDKNQLPLVVMNDILGGGGFGARMMQNLREDKGYTYGCYSSVRVSNYGSYFNSQGSFRNDVTDSAITEILYEIKHITEGLVTKDELSLTKSSMAGDFARSLEDPSTLARFAYTISRNNLPKDYYQTYLKRLESVTDQDVLNMALNYLNLNGITIVVVGSEDVLDKISVFDADGVIEKFDAFGNPAKDLKPTTVAKESVIQEYIFAATQTKSMRSAYKKLKKIKSYTELATLSSPQIPVTIESKRVWGAPNKEAILLSIQGSPFQKNYFDGKEGQTWSPQGTNNISQDEIDFRSKQVGILPEMNFEKGGVTYELKGIEETDLGDMYVIYYSIGKFETYDYYSTESHLKMKTVSIDKSTEEPKEKTTYFSNYTDVNGILFPFEYELLTNGMSISGSVNSIEVNKSINWSDFK